MLKRIASTILAFSHVLLLCSCNRNGGIIIGEEARTAARMEQIVSAFKDRNSAVLRSLFSEKAQDEADDIDSEIDRLFDFIEGDIDSWKQDGWSSDESANHGKKSMLIRFRIDIKTNEKDYILFIMDYNTDTINQKNEGVYMLEVCLLSYSGEWESVQDRMKAGVFIYE